MSGGSGAPGSEGASPAKRKVMDLEPEAEVEVVEKGGFSLTTLQATLQTELRANRAEIRANQEGAISTIREDIKQAVGGVQKRDGGARRYGGDRSYPPA